MDPASLKIEFDKQVKDADLKIAEAEKQLIQYKLADMYSEYNLGLLGCYQVATLVDDKESKPEMISLIKRNSCQKSLDISRKCRDILGGNGISEEYHIFRHLTNLETFKRLQDF